MPIAFDQRNMRAARRVRKRLADRAAEGGRWRAWRSAATIAFVAVFLAVRPGAVPDGQAAAADPVPPGRLVLPSGGSATVKGGDDESLRIGFAAVVSDERCPSETNCAWARPPVVAFELAGSRRNTVRASCGPSAPATRFENWSIRCLDLEPAPVSTARFGKVEPFAVYSVILSVDPR